MKMLILALSLLTLSGCAIWPKQGQGGWGENFLRHQDGNESIWYTESYSNLKRDLEHLRLRLEIMRAQGIAQCMPARLKLATLMASRITRQLTGNMLAQTEHDLGVFYHQVNLLQRHFDEIQQATECGQVLRSTHIAAVDTDIKKAVEALLNSDNQFAFTDENITPKYLHRIQQAAELLSNFTQIDLLLIGHTDNVGTETANYQLGQTRAERVKQALLDEGLSKARITVVSKGESTPYFKGDSLADHLSNRRVEAVVLSLSDNEAARVQSQAEAEGLILKQWTHTIEVNGSKPQ